MFYNSSALTIPSSSLCFGTLIGYTNILRFFLFNFKHDEISLVEKCQTKIVEKMKSFFAPQQKSGLILQEAAIQKTNICIQKKQSCN